jgi:hypothetical protein
LKKLVFENKGKTAPRSLPCPFLSQAHPTFILIGIFGKHEDTLQGTARKKKITLWQGESVALVELGARERIFIKVGFFINLFFTCIFLLVYYMVICSCTNSM